MQDIWFRFDLTHKDFRELLKNEEQNELDHLCVEIGRTLINMGARFQFTPFELADTERDEDTPVFEIYACNKLTCDAVFNLIKEHE